MKQSAILGYQFTGKANNVSKSFNFFIRRFFLFSLVDCWDLSNTVRQLILAKKHNSVYAILDLNSKYYFEAKEKTPLAAFAILYDFVDSFVIKGFDDLQDDIDPIIKQRMYCDEYRKIYLEVESSLLYDEMDELLNYSMLSNIDGLIISNQRLLKYAAEKSNGSLALIAKGVTNAGQLKEFTDMNVSSAIYASNKISFLAQWLGRKIEKSYKELISK